MIHQLKTFSMVARLESVTLAAQKLFITQPAVTQQIRQIEAHYGKKLISRFGHRMVLTPEGQRLLGATRDLIEKYDALKNVFKAEQPQETIRFSSIDSVTHSLLPVAMKTFQKKYPLVTLEPSIRSSQQGQIDVAEGRLDLTLCTLDQLPENLVGETLFKEKFVIVAGKEHQQIKRISELEKTPFIIFPESARSRHLINLFFARQKIIPKILFEILQTSSILPFVKAGIAVSVVPCYSVCGKIDNKELFELPIKTNITRLVGIAYKKGSTPTMGQISFMHLLQRMAKTFSTPRVWTNL